MYQSDISKLFILEAIRHSPDPRLHDWGYEYLTLRDHQKASARLLHMLHPTSPYLTEIGCVEKALFTIARDLYTPTRLPYIAVRPAVHVLLQIALQNRHKRTVRILSEFLQTQTNEVLHVQKVDYQADILTDYLSEGAEDLLYETILIEVLHALTKRQHFDGVPRDLLVGAIAVRNSLGQAVEEARGGSRWDREDFVELFDLDDLPFNLPNEWYGAFEKYATYLTWF